MVYQIIIVDNHPTIGIGTKYVLEKNKEFHVTYVKTGSIALQIAQNIKIDLMLCDLYMRDTDSITLVKDMLKQLPEMKILIFTGFAYDHVLNELLDIGVSGIVSKTIHEEELYQKIIAALKGNTIIPTHLFKRLRAVEENLVYETSSLLSKHERYLTMCLVNGCSNREISEQLYLSQRAVEYQLRKLYQRFAQDNRKSFIKYVIDHKLLESPYGSE